MAGEAWENAKKELKKYFESVIH